MSIESIGETNAEETAADQIGPEKPQADENESTVADEVGKHAIWVYDEHGKGYAASPESVTKEQFVQFLEEGKQIHGLSKYIDFDDINKRRLLFELLN